VLKLETPESLAAFVMVSLFDLDIRISNLSEEGLLGFLFTFDDLIAFLNIAQMYSISPYIQKQDIISFQKVKSLLLYLPGRHFERKRVRTNWDAEREK